MMGLLIGALLIGIAVALAGMSFAVFSSGHDWLFTPSMVLLVGTLVAALVGFGLWIMLGGASGPRIVEGACYRAVRTTTMTVIPAGKVLVPSTTSGVSLEEIRCPGI